MSTSQHTYGPTCLLSPPHYRTRDGVADNPPPLRGQFFYASGLALDDPLSPLPTAAASVGLAAAKHPPRPFSAHDNAALEEAWQSWERRKRAEIMPQSNGRVVESTARIFKEHARPSSPVTRDATAIEAEVNGGASTGDGLDAPPPAVDVAPTSRPMRSHAASVSVKTSSGKGKAPSPAYGSSPSDASTTGTPFVRAPPRVEMSRLRDTAVIERDDAGDGSHQAGRDGTANGEDDGKDHLEPGPQSPRPPTGEGQRDSASISVPVGISRLHVVKLPNLQMRPIYWSISPAQDVTPVIRGTWFYRESMLPVEPEIANQLELGYAALKPWSDTWRDELRCAVEVGADAEVKIAHSIWPEQGPGRSETGSRPSSSRGDGQGGRIGHDAMEARTEPGELSAQGQAPASSKRTQSADVNDPEDPLAPKVDALRLYAKSSVIYANTNEAYILRPSLQPSAYYGRRPLAKIRRGVPVGVPVLRGFDWRAWERLHPSKKSKAVSQTEQVASASRSGAATSGSQKHCVACAAGERRPQVTDLMFVIHGIGQKYSERDESFNFTHAINNFRRLMHIQLATDAVKPHLRRDFGGVMVLPVNWRTTIALSDEGPLSDSQTKPDNEFTLKDITPDTLPTVRNLVSDVMLDIPYYLSDHRPKMIQAVVREANRIYRLWCQNNPGFHEHGRCHIVAHSLGSAMAIDILSQQPTTIPALNLSSPKISEQRFDFDTKNLFLVGSPAGFFLLLNRGSLQPRKDRNKPGADTGDLARGVAGEVGTYGCVAVDNLYNIVNYNDPIGYLIGATLDAPYAASLRPAAVPSTTPSLFSTISSVFRPTALAPPPIAPLTSTIVTTATTTTTATPTATTTAASSTTLPSTAPSSTTTGPDIPPLLAANPTLRLPSTIELATHDFSSEEIGSTKFHLLNDTGQLDWFLSSSSGPLDLQYLNMLGAHSSYWLRGPGGPVSWTP
ncbi:MAG: hypothetical protein M1838_000819 [Thelocarpon superellum]|nr:MAG: hypothetical protein M1838_000819 [Thelocarpon superellum]